MHHQTSIGSGLCGFCSAKVSGVLEDNSASEALQGPYSGGGSCRWVLSDPAGLLLALEHKARPPTAPGQ